MQSWFFTSFKIKISPWKTLVETLDWNDVSCKLSQYFTIFQNMLKHFLTSLCLVYILELCNQRQLFHEDKNTNLPIVCKERYFRLPIHHKRVLATNFMAQFAHTTPLPWVNKSLDQHLGLAPALCTGSSKCTGICVCACMHASVNWIFLVIKQVSTSW